MAVTVLIPTTLRAFTNQRSEFELEGNTVGEIIRTLADEYPETKKALFDENGLLRQFINVFVNGEDIKVLQGNDTPVKSGDEIMLIPAIAGGTPTESVPGDTKGEKLTNDEILRYSRHLLLKEVGIKGQKKLKAAKVLIVGMGGLGAPLAQYLAAAGVGQLGLIDFDEVDATNLQRQVIHGTRDIGRPKVASAKDSIKQINPLVKVETYNYMLTAENALDIIAEYDVVADASDNYQCRYLVNDACVLLGKPDVFGAMYQFEGQASVYYAKEGPCYRCMYPAPPPAGLVPSCAMGGVMGALPGIIGTIQANEVIKLIVGGGETLAGRLLNFDAWKMRFRELKIHKDPNCPICGQNPTITKLEEYDYADFCGLKKQEEEEAPVEAIEAKGLKRRLDEGERITIIDVREPHERAITKFLDAKVIPIGQLDRRQNELDPTVDTVFVCKEGKRSILAVNTLREAGYKGRMFNLKDGINAWAREIDPTMPQYGALTPKWITKLLEFKGLESGIYRVNKVKEGDTPLDVLCSATKKSDIVPQGYVEYEEQPREYRLNSISTIININTQIEDVYSSPYDQAKEQLNLAIESLRERQESQLINNDDYGLLKNVADSQRIQTRNGAPTPDDIDELITKVWKEPSFFLAHPRAIAAFERECTKRGVPPVTANIAGGNFILWRGIPIVPTDKLLVDGLKNPKSKSGKTNILLIRTGEAKRGVIGLYQANLKNEQSRGLAVRYRGIDDKGVASHLLSLYCSAAILSDDAIAVLEDVEVGEYYDYD